MRYRLGRVRASDKPTSLRLAVEALAAGLVRRGPPIASVTRLQRGIFHPSIGHDHIGGRIPIAILVQTGVEAVAVVIDNLDGLRELNFAVGSKSNIPKLSHPLLGFHPSDRQAASAHVDNFFVADFRCDGSVSGLTDLVLAVLIQLRPKQIVPVVVMLVFSKSDAPDHQNANGSDEAY